jgi:hypothetical protein
MGSRGRGRGRGRGSYNGPPPYQPIEGTAEFVPRAGRPPSVFPVTLQTLSPGELEPKDRHFPSRLSLLEWVQSAPRGSLKAFATHAEPETIYGKSEYHTLDVNRIYGIHYLEVNQEGEVALPIVDPVPLPRERTVEEVKVAEQDDYAGQNPGEGASVN